jgi:hypothetical protein
MAFIRYNLSKLFVASTFNSILGKYFYWCPSMVYERFLNNFIAVLTIPSNSETVQFTPCSGIVLNPLLMLKY